MRDILIILFCVAVVAVGWYVFVASRGHEVAAPTDRGITGEGGQTDRLTPAEKLERSQEAARLLGAATEAERTGDQARVRELLGKAAEYGDTWAGTEARKRLAALPKEQAASAATAAGAKAPTAGSAQEVVLDEAPSRPDEPYAVQLGETLSSISRRLGTSVEQIKLANHKRDDFVRAGERLIVSWRMPTVVVDKEGLKLYLLYHGEVARIYPAAIGKGDGEKELSATPEGVFVIDARIKDPPWYRRGERIEHSDPRNILGTRWMGFKPTSDLTGYGIHGTTQPETVPGRVSNGCIRMRNADVEELFEWVPKGTKVYVLSRWQPPTTAGAGTPSAGGGEPKVP
jgi:lipoprotein-anchoring transpeptidase ErfK/SrfK